MKYLLPTARGVDRTNAIENLPFDTWIITNVMSYATFDFYFYSPVEGYWRALNHILEKNTITWREPFVWLADDIQPQEGWHEIAEQCFKEKFPDGLGLVALNDLNVMHGGAAFAVTTKAWLYVLFGEPQFPTNIAHNFLDTIIADRSKDLGRYYFCEESVVEHMHHSIGKGEDDEVYALNRKRAKENKDKKEKDKMDTAWAQTDRNYALERLEELEKKTAYFVLGSEGAGTHMMRDALFAAGCHWEQWFEEADESKLDFHGLPDKIVVRRSIPHAHKWPRLEEIHARLEAAGYNVFVIFTIRDFHASAKSVLRRGYGGDLEDCYENQFESILRLGKYLDYSIYFPNFVYSTYEAFTTSAGFRKWLFGRIGLPYPKDFEVQNRDNKYYEGDING